MIHHHLKIKREIKKCVYEVRVICGVTTEEVGRGYTYFVPSERQLQFNLLIYSLIVIYSYKNRSVERVLSILTFTIPTFE